MLSVSRFNEVCIPLSNLTITKRTLWITLLYLLRLSLKVLHYTVSKANSAAKGPYLSGSLCFAIIFPLTHWHENHEGLLPVCSVVMEKIFTELQNDCDRLWMASICNGPTLGEWFLPVVCRDMAQSLQPRRNNDAQTTPKGKTFSMKSVLRYSEACAQSSLWMKILFAVSVKSIHGNWKYSPRKPNNLLKRT